MSNLTMSVDVKLGLFMRLFLWTYAIPASTNRLNTCKLFWGFVFMPLVLPFSVLIRGVSKVLSPVGRFLRSKADKRVEESLAKAYTGPSRGERALDFTADRASAFWAKFQTFFKWAGIVIGILLAITLIVLAVLFVEVTLKVLLIAVLTALLVGALFALIWLTIEVVDSSIGRTLGSAGRSVHQKTCARVRITK